MSKKKCLKREQRRRKELEKSIPKGYKYVSSEIGPSKTTSILIKLLSFIILVFSILFGGFIDYPPTGLTLMFFCTSLLCMLLAFLSKGKVPLFFPIKVDPVSFTFIMISTSLACAIKIFIINYINTYLLAFYIILFLVIFFILFLLIDRESRKTDCKDLKADRNILTFFGALAFSISFVVVINNALDSREPEVHSVSISEKIKKVDDRFFYVQLSTNWPYYYNNEVIIGEDLYNSVSIGDKIDIVVWKGTLGLKYCRAHK
ncbi:MAG: hypothetical protein ACEPOV_07770 [Hyphomicrobiales bacterium]